MPATASLLFENKSEFKSGVSTTKNPIDYASQPGNAAACFNQLAICFSSSWSFS
jgi:hypothetical protein